MSKKQGEARVVWWIVEADKEELWGRMESTIYTLKICELFEI